LQLPHKYPFVSCPDAAESQVSIEVNLCEKSPASGVGSLLSPGFNRELNSLSFIHPHQEPDVCSGKEWPQKEIAEETQVK